MGISGLLPLLKSIHKPCSIKKFDGQTIGVDAYGWLHRGTVACALALALEKPSFKHVDYAMNKVRMLIHFGVTPYLVFDGDYLPSKAGTEIERAKRRDESRKLGLELYSAGKTSQAQQELQKAVDITPYMARQLIEELKKLEIPYVVAPYEADAQLAYLEKHGIIDGVLSEDSDLLVFGVTRLLTKLDQYGNCVEVNRADFTSCRDISLIGWTDTDFRRMAILSGCDYLPSINKMGLKTSYRYIRKYKDIEKILRMLQFERQLIVPDGYLDKFRQAELTFLHHRVFCPKSQKLVLLTELEKDKEEDMPFIGKDMDPETAIGVACGDLDPMTKKPIRVCGKTLQPESVDPYPRRKTLGTSAELVSKKPIDSFFKPRRQPLAELDPNSLTPSPSQQRLLEVHANASWEARTTSSAPQLRRFNSSLPGPIHMSQEPIRSTDRTAFLARAATASTYQPPKRPRLCSDADESSPTKFSKSPFFADNGNEPSPSIRKKSKSKKVKKSNFDIFSDDSVDELLLQMPEAEEAISLPKAKVFVDKLAGGKGNREVQLPQVDPTQVDDVDTVPETSQPGSPIIPLKPCLDDEDSFTSIAVPSLSVSQMTAATVDSIERIEDLSEDHVHGLDEAILDNFVSQQQFQQAPALESTSQPRTREYSPTVKEFQPNTWICQSPQRQAAALRTLEPFKNKERYETRQGSLKDTFSSLSQSEQATALRSLSRQQNPEAMISLGRAALASFSRANAIRRPLTPLQQLGQHALRKTRSEISITKATPAILQLATAAKPGSENQMGHESESPAAKSGPLVEATTFCGRVGSEDMIVPNSEDEGDEVSDDGGKLPRCTLDLKAYAFTRK